MKDVLKKIEELITPVALESALEIVDLAFTKENGRTILKVFIDKAPSGVSLKDCADFSHAIEDMIEVENIIPFVYDLEVGSPGVNRVLNKKAHFERVIGKMIRAKTTEPIDNRRNYKGILKAVNDVSFTVEIDRQNFIVPFAKLEKANLEFFE